MLRADRDLRIPTRQMDWVRNGRLRFGCEAGRMEAAHGRLDMEFRPRKDAIGDFTRRCAMVVLDGMSAEFLLHALS
jgi:hypothetical protein